MQAVGPNTHPPTDQQIVGTITFNHPLVIPAKTGKDEYPIYGDTSWKMNLSKKYQKKGKALSKTIAQAGYDGIVTVRKDGKGTGEIVDLRFLHTGIYEKNPALPGQTDLLSWIEGEKGASVPSKSPSRSKLSKAKFTLRQGQQTYECKPVRSNPADYPMKQAQPTPGWGGSGWPGALPPPRRPKAWQRRYVKQEMPFLWEKDRSTIVDRKGIPHTIPNSDKTNDEIVFKRTDLRDQGDRWRLSKNSFGHYRLDSDTYERTFYSVDEVAEFLSKIKAVMV